MSESQLKSLPSDTVRLIGSSQVITSVFSVVKELVENSFDAESTAIEVKLENFGLDKIEVRDNGLGIKKCNIPLVAKRYHTSKISSFSDLEHLTTYGFRGEALGSLCAVSSLVVISKTSEEDVSHMYTFDHHGNVVNNQPSHLGQGTTISAGQLFKNMPVRRQFYNTVKKKKDELKKVEDLLMAYGAIRPNVRLSLRNNKDVVWQKSIMADTRSALLSIMGRNVLNQLEQKTVTSDKPEISIEAYLPKAGSDVNVTSRCTGDRCFVAVNKRPVQMKELEKCVKQYYCHHKACSGRYPIYFLSLHLPVSSLDVNVDPNKTRVMLHEQKCITLLVTEMLEEIYGPIRKNSDENSGKTNLENSDICNDSVCSNISSDSSFDSSSCGGTTGLPSGKVKLTNHRTCSISSDQLKDNSSNFKISEHSNKSIPGFKISFYDADKNIVEVDDGKSLSKDLIVDIGGKSLKESHDCASGEKEETKILGDANHLMNLETNSAVSESLIGSTQIEKGNFDILDDDFQILLASQSSGNTKLPFPDTNCLDVSTVGDFGEICSKVKTITNSEDVFTGIKVNISDNSNVGQEGDNVKNADLIEKITNNSKNEFNNNCSIINWSKGTSEHHNNGVCPQPVQILTGVSHQTKKRSLSPSDDLEMIGATPPVKKKALCDLADQPSLYDYVGKSPAEKYPMGFVSFSKVVRPKAVEDHPEAPYDEITCIVRSKWDKLSDVDKQQFAESGRVEMQDLKKKISVKRRLSQKIDRRILPVKGTPSIKDQLLGVNKNTMESTTNTVVKSVKMPFSLNTLRKKFHTGLRQTENTDPIRHCPDMTEKLLKVTLNITSQTEFKETKRLIGPLKFYNGWICCHGNELKVINPHRVEETLVHRELMQNHVITATKLDNPLRLDENLSGGTALYKKLLELVPEDSHQTYMNINDKRLTSNGFQVRCHLDQDGCPVLDVVGLAQCMPTYSITDLREVLELIVNTGATSVHQSRPTKVIYYLQGEAIRMVRQRPVHRSYEDMVDILEQMTDTLPVDCVQCLHNKPLLYTVYDMDNIPATQSVV